MDLIPSFESKYTNKGEAIPNGGKMCNSTDQHRNRNPEKKKNGKSEPELRNVKCPSPS